MNDLHQLHNQANNAFALRLFDALSPVRGITGHIGKTDEAPTGRPLVRADAAGEADEGSDFTGREGPIA